MEARLIIWFIIGALAVFRLTDLVVRDEGPFRVFERLRNLFIGNNWIARGIRCPLCVSFWMSAAVAALLWSILEVPLAAYPLLWFGLSGSFYVLYRHYA